MFRAIKPASSRHISPWTQECEPNKFLTDIQPREETSETSEKQILGMIKSTWALTLTSKEPVAPIPQPESISASPLFRLPRELRDIIHRCVITARKLKTRTKRATRYPYPFAAYLLTCRAIHQEAIIMFYNYRTFTILPPPLHPLPNTIFHHARHIRLTINMTDPDPLSPLPPLLLPSPLTTPKHHDHDHDPFPFPSARHLHIHLAYPRHPPPPPTDSTPSPPPRNQPLCRCCEQKCYATLHAQATAIAPALRRMDELVLSSSLIHVGQRFDLRGWFVWVLRGWVEDALNGEEEEEEEEEASTGDDDVVVVGEEGNQEGKRARRRMVGRFRDGVRYLGLEVGPFRWSRRGRGRRKGEGEGEGEGATKGLNGEEDGDGGAKGVNEEEDRRG